MSTTEDRSSDASGTASVGSVDTKLEVIVIPVSDVDRAKEFYGRLGWRLDADFRFDNGFRVVQFTPPRLGVLDPIRHARHADRSGLSTKSAPGRLRHRDCARGPGRPRCRRQWSVSPWGARRAIPARRLKLSPSGTRARSQQLPLLCGVQRPGRQRLAVAGGHHAATRARRPCRDGIRLCEGSGERASAGRGRLRKARKAHWAARCEPA